MAFICKGRIQKCSSEEHLVCGLEKVMPDFLAFFHFQVICSSLPSASPARVLCHGSAFSHLG